jgi:hypothetical protein
MFCATHALHIQYNPMLTHHCGMHYVLIYKQLTHDVCAICSYVQTMRTQCLCAACTSVPTVHALGVCHTYLCTNNAYRCCVCNMFPSRMRAPSHEYSFHMSPTVKLIMYAYSVHMSVIATIITYAYSVYVNATANPVFQPAQPIILYECRSQFNYAVAAELFRQCNNPTRLQFAASLPKRTHV